MDFTDDQPNCEWDSKPEPIGMKQTVKALNQSLLHSEIGFWREMLHSSDDYTPAASIERMKQALALAEHKLNELLRYGSSRVRLRGKPVSMDTRRKSGNVHYLSNNSQSQTQVENSNPAKLEK